RVLSRMDQALPSFRDQAILAALPDLCLSLFREREVQALTDNQQAVLVEQIRRRFSADINQIARVTGLSHEKLVRYFDGF
ncbi:MAG: hypothetical protein K6A62_02530, partial [Bacteroidales bacterium]|nr:hypothetical protein [Bacteroidales bacterium]